MASYDDAFSQLQLLLTEQVEPNVHGLELPGDDVAWTLMDTFPAISTAGRMTGTTGSTTVGSEDPGYEASWRIRLNRAGRVSGGSWSGNTMTRMGPNDLLNVGQAVDDLYLDPVYTPSRSVAKIAMYLKRLQGQVVINRTQLEANIISDPIEDIAAGYIEDAVYQVRETCSAMFWSQGYGVMALVNYASGYTVTDSAITQVAVDNGTIFRFVEGQRYVAATLSSGVPTTARAGTLNTPGVMRCVSIDTDNLTIGLQAEPGEVSISLSDNDALILEGLYNFSGGGFNYAVNGIEALLINTGTYPGTAYSVTTHKELQSYILDNSSSPVAPTPELVAQMIDKITNPGYEPPSTLIAERSIWTYYSQLERQGHAVYNVPQGAPFQASGGVGAPMLSHGQYTFARLSSAKCREGTIYGIAPETFRRFMPGGGKSLRWNFVSGGQSGVPAIFHPITDGRRMSRVSSAEFDFWLQFGQVLPRRCFIMKGVLSQYAADAA